MSRTRNGFPQPEVHYFKCEKWIKVCDYRTPEDCTFTLKKMKSLSFICTKDFVGAEGPTPRYTESIAAFASNVEVKGLNTETTQKLSLDRKDLIQFALAKTKKKVPLILGFFKDSGKSF